MYDLLLQVNICCIIFIAYLWAILSTPSFITHKLERKRFSLIAIASFQIILSVSLFILFCFRNTAMTDFTFMALLVIAILSVAEWLLSFSIHRDRRIFSFFIFIIIYCLCLAFSTEFKKILTPPPGVVVARTIIIKSSIADDIKLKVRSNGVDIREEIENYIQVYFSQKNASILLTTSEDNYLEFSITGLKGEILTDKNLWEKIQVCIHYYENNEKINIVIMFDGQYSAGIGPPSIESYLDMEPKFRYQLDNYTKAMLVKLKHHLIKSHSI